MNRAEFQKLATVRIDEARTLLENGKYAGAYYLAGYSIECALKACIAKKTRRHDFPPDRKFLENCYTHNVGKLVDAAGLLDRLNLDIRANKLLEKNWSTVKDWSEESRYQRHTKPDAQGLIDAIMHETDGVLTWIKRHW